MLWSHPLVQVIALVLSVPAVLFGWKRFLAVHCGQKCVFPWKQHVRWGTYAIALWLGGGLLGSLLVWFYWRNLFLTGVHAYVGLVMLPLCVIGYMTGYRLDKEKRRRKWLPLVHGVNNLVLVALALWQLWTGVSLVRLYLM
ncbi:DUF4079 family protein [Nitratidesulfovibrio vulgaris]|uniref:DUF4079 domain-containing protein n=2 Tax=Nitratidesulfovibrio vulgaris TaxID=881 RepID=Q72B28_NITV2|nr:DUF4079 family protein [Nitratidesulfovibrio vulgaris]GEB79470.1 DUF4079 domain-containing protein [Desulfovibrio desulfuricans]HBW15412.1 DUF4079 domain-containing protein [Desulfovibrio sp.]AAS96287.1 hypothetical protein DVU_1810 [Nitratidesulfovibrio vulgaris str. Hildenborough]ABM28368.1 conserved hypothetical protein [Nitratidesulfovibrio vulgaris DP4]ADP86648.1 hypothetical protein Deval_1493 [Nitratidesulfovibrio vulgaris RCH1]